MGYDEDQQYLVNNQKLVEDFLSLIDDYQLLSARFDREDGVECFNAAQRLRGTLGNLIRLETGGGFLKALLTRLQGALGDFVAAGRPSGHAYARNISELNRNLDLLRRVFAKETKQLLQAFPVTPPNNVVTLLQSAG